MVRGMRIDPNSKFNRVELHCHSKAGEIGTMKPGEIAEYLSGEDATAFAITDDSSIWGFPMLECLMEFGILTAAPIFGLEVRVKRDGNEKNCEEFDIVSILIRNYSGMVNVCHLLEAPGGKDGKPVLDAEELFGKHGGLLFGTGGSKGRVYRMALEGASDEELTAELGHYDYAEVLPFEEYREINKRIIRLSDEIGVTVVAVCEAAFCDEAGRNARRVRSYHDYGTDVVADNHFWTDEEMLSAFNYLPEKKARKIVIDNTHRLKNLCGSFQVTIAKKSYPQTAYASSRLRDMCMFYMRKKYPDRPSEVLSVLEWELDALARTHMETYMIQVKEILDGLGLGSAETSIRGTAAGSIVAYLLGISNVDPIRFNLAPEMVFSLEQDREIDIDLNVPTGLQEEAFVCAGRVESVSNAVRASMAKLISEEEAGEMLEQYMADCDIFFTDAMQYDIIECLKDSYICMEKHPGGVYLIPTYFGTESKAPTILTKGLDLKHYDYGDVRAFLKQDIFGQDGTEMLIKLSLLTDVALEKVPIDDEKVLKLFAAGAEVMERSSQDSGCRLPRFAKLPDFGSDYVRTLIEALRPKSVEDLAKIIALAHGTGVYNELISSLVDVGRLGIKDIIATRDDVMDYCISLGIGRKTAFRISEDVRKGKIAKGWCHKWREWKRLLISLDAPEWFIYSCEHITYLFPRAQALSYVIVNMRLGWFMVNYPKEFETVMSEYGAS